MKRNLFIRQLGEYFEVFLPDIKKCSRNTISAYSDSFAVFFRFLFEQKSLPHHGVTYKHLTPALFDEYMLWLKNERSYSNGSIRHRITAIRSFLKYASRREMSALNAYSTSTATDCPTGKSAAFPYFVKEEMRILFSLPSPDKYLGDRDLVLLPFLYDTAARAQELCDVRVGDIRFGNTTKVKLRGKGGKVREVPITDDVAKLLHYHINRHGLTGKESRMCPLFSSQTNKQMTVACVRSIVKKYVALAKKTYPDLFLEPHYSPHSFRHSKAVHMVEAGVNLIYIRNFLGHEFIRATEVYARVGQETVTKALTNRKIPSLAGKPPDPEQTKCPLPTFLTCSH